MNNMQQVLLSQKKKKKNCSPKPKIIQDIVRELWYELSHAFSGEDVGRITSKALWSNDVFLNFRGEDTHNSFIGQLHVALKKKGVPLEIMKILREENIY